MKRAHWLHRIGGRGRQLAAYAAGELPPAEQAHVAALVADCPACRREVEAYQRVTAALRGTARVSLTTGEAATFLPEVNRRIDRGQGARAPQARRRLREVVWDHPRVSWASAFTAALFIIGLTVSQWQMWGVSGTTGTNGVEVVSVEVAEDASVMVFQAPGSSLKIIWVFEDNAT